MEPAQLNPRSPGAERAAYLILALAFLVPTLAFVKNALLDFDPAAFGLSFFLIVGHSLVFTALQSSVSAALACAVGIGLGVLVHREWNAVSPRVRRAARALAYLNFTLPGVVVASLVLEACRLTGLPDQGYLPVILAHTAMNVLLIAFVSAERAAAFASGAGRPLLDVARIHGAPASFRARVLGEGALFDVARAYGPLVFLWSASAFATVLMLGGAPSRATPEVLMFHSQQLDPSAGRVLVLFVVQAVLGALLARAAFARVARGEFAEAGDDFETSPSLSLRSRRATLVVGAAIVVAALPIARVAFGALVALGDGGSTNLSATRVGGAVTTSLAVAVLAALFAQGYGWLLAQAGSKVRRLAAMLAGVGTTALAILWSQLGLDRLGAAWPPLQLLLLALAVATSLVPLLAFWLELRVGRLSRATFDVAQMLGCPEPSLARAIALPQTRDVRQRVVAMAGLLALGELGFAGLFVFDWPLLSSLSKNMALRYDFRGTQISLLAILVLAVVFGVVSRARAERAR